MRVSKYNASGNDFVIFHAFKSDNRSKLAKELCNRFSGIGADGLIVLLPHFECDFAWEFYNSDGSRASMCGNGARAALKYAFDNKLCFKNAKFVTGAGVIEGVVEDDFVEILLTKPRQISQKFGEFGFNWEIYDTGVPHLVSFVDNLDHFDEQICKFMREKYNANVNFAKVTSQNTIEVRTYERGVEGETLACGTGMAAVFCGFLGQKNSLSNLDKVQVKITPKSGEELDFRAENGLIYFKGKVGFCFEATL